MGSAVFDFSELERFAGRLDSVAAKDLGAVVKPIVQRGAGNVQRAMRADMAGSSHFKQVARKITFETRPLAGSVTCDVGPITEGKVTGDLAHFAYFGGANGGGGSVRDPQAALDDEAPTFFEHIGKVLDGLL